MRILLISRIVALLATLVLEGMADAATIWVKVDANDANNVVLQVNQARIEPSGPGWLRFEARFTALERTKDLGPAFPGAYNVTMVYDVECATGRKRLLETTQFGETGQVIEAQSFDNPVIEPIKPGSLMDSARRFVCSEAISDTDK